MKYKYIMHLLLCFALIHIGAAQRVSAKGAYFTSDSVTVGKNASFDLSLRLLCDNVMPVAFQFELVLPSGIELNMDINDSEQVKAILNEERLDGHLFSISSRGSGRYRFLLFSVGNKKLKGEEGVMLTLPLRTTSNASIGGKEVRFESVFISNEMEQSVTLSSRNGLITVIDMVEVPKEASFALSNVRSERSKSFTMSLNMMNTTEVTAFQFDLILPKEINLNVDFASSSFDNLFTSSRRNGHSLVITSLGENRYRFVAFSVNNNAFKGEKGEMLSIPLSIPEKTFDGVYTVKLEHVFISDLQGKDITQDITDGEVEVYTGSTPMKGAYLEIPEAKVVKNQHAIIMVNMYNYSPATAFQCDILFPEGIVPVLPDDLNGIFNAERITNHVLTVSGIGSDKYRFLAISMTNSSFTGNMGSILEIPVKVLSSCQPGEYELKLESVLISDSNNKDMTLDPKNGMIIVQEKENIDMSGVSLNDLTVTYNGAAHQLLIEGTLPEGVIQVVYTGNGVIEAGIYEIIASFEVSEGYNKPADMKATLVINPAKVEGIYLADGTFTYDGQPHSLFINGDLPESVSVQYTGNEQINVGVYVVTASFQAGKNYIAPEDKMATMTINRANIDMSNILFEDRVVTYTGEAYSISISGDLPEGITKVTYSDMNCIDAGSYEITASFDVDDNHNKPEDVKANLIIIPAETGEIIFPDGEFTYDGESHSLFVTSLPEEVTVSYEGNGQVNAGVYTVIAKFITSSNYKTPEDKTAVLTINKALIDMGNVSFHNKTVVYDGEIHTLAIEGDLPNGIIQVVYSQNQYRNIGQYEVTAGFEVDNNHHKPNDLKATLTIMPRDAGEVFLPDGTFTYDGQPHFLQIIGDLPEGITVSYEGNGQINAGVYTIIARFTSDGNHIAPDDVSATLTINKANVDISNIGFENKQVVYDGTEYSLQITGTLPEGVMTVIYSGENFVNAGTYDITATFEVDDNHNKPQDLEATLTIVPARLEDLSFSDITVVYNGEAYSLKLDNVLPEGVTVSYENNGQMDAGIYTVIARLTSNGNYSVPEMLEATLIILKANVDMRNVSFEDKEVVYDGANHNLSLTMDSLPIGIEEVIYSENDYIAVGSYEITVSFVVNSNFEKPADMSAWLTIVPAEVTEIYFNDLSIMYDGMPHSIFIDGELPNGVMVEYEGNGQTQVGTYTVIARFSSNRNYITPADMFAQLTIIRADVIIEELPVSTSINFGESLSRSVLSGGKASVNGTFKWKNEETIVEESGEYEVIFTPDDSMNYNEVTFYIQVNVLIPDVYHKVVLLSAENGEVKIRNKSDDDIYQEGVVLELEAIPNNGYVLDTFLANGNPIASSYTVVEEAEITAIFKLDVNNIINNRTSVPFAYGKESAIVIQTDFEIEVSIYTLSGQIIYQEIITAPIEFAVGRAWYVVKLNNMNYKIRVD